MKEHPISELLQSVVTKMGTMVDTNLVVEMRLPRMNRLLFRYRRYVAGL